MALNVSEELQKLAELNKSGALSDAEFAAAKAHVLSGAAQSALSPTAPSPAAAPPAHPAPLSPTVAAKPKKSGLVSSLVSLAVVVGILAVIYSLLPKGGKDVVNLLASQNALTARVVPWVDRADTATRLMMNGESGATAARSIRNTTHPTGNGGTMSSFDVRKVGDHISVKMTVDWTGGFMGTAYTTVVVWEFDEHRHIRAKVVGDNAMIAVAAKNEEQLNEYFRSEFYPVLQQNIKG